MGSSSSKSVSLFDVQTSAEIQESLLNNEDILDQEYQPKSRSLVSQIFKPSSFEHDLPKGTPFFYHCKKNNIEAALTLFRNGCDVNYHTQFFPTNSIEILCSEGHAELLKILLSSSDRPDVCWKEIINTRTKFDTPLITSIVKEHTDIFDILLDHGADPNIPNKLYSPLQLCSRFNSIYMVDKLLTYQLDINYKSYKGTTALHLCESLPILHRLIIYGADMNIQDNNGYTPLHYFISEDRFDDGVEALIDFGADTNIPNNEGYTPKMTAEKRNNKKIFDLL